MKARVVAMCVVFVLISPAWAAEVQPYPDLSSPKSAAFSLLAALEEGDIQTCRMLYVGDQQEYPKLLEAIEKLKLSCQQFGRVATSRFGRNAAPLLQCTQGPQLKVDEQPMAALVAVAEVNVEGKQATIPIGNRFLVRLENTKKGWFVTEIPPPALLLLVTQTVTPAIEQATKDIADGKYVMAHDAYNGFVTTLAKELQRSSPEILREMKKAGL